MSELSKKEIIQKNYDQMVLENPENLQKVPYEFKTYTMCLGAIIARPDLIKQVPVTILTEQFEADLRAHKVEIPYHLKRYMGICKKIQRKREQLAVSMVEDSSIPEEIAIIPLTTLSSLISLPLLRDFQDLGIENLGQLFRLTPDDMNVFKWSGRHPRVVELKGTQKILKCKYLNEDPMIDEEDETLEMNLVYSNLGLSVRAYNGLLRSKKFATAKEFFSVMRSEDAEYELYSVRDCGQISRDEIIEKSRIIIEYHDRVNGIKADSKKTNVVKRITEKEIIASLESEDSIVADGEVKGESLKIFDRDLSGDSSYQKIISVNGRDYDSANPSDREDLLNLLENYNIRLHPDSVMERINDRLYENMSLESLRNELQKLGKINDEINKAIAFVLEKITEKEKEREKGGILE